MNMNDFMEVEHYIGNLFANEDQVLSSVKESLTAANMPQHSIFPNQGKFLTLLANLANATRILEIGTLGGYSTIWLARSLPETGALISIELDPDYATVAKENVSRAGLENRVTIRVGEALSVLDDLGKEEVEPFDLIFMDAHKPSYIEYFEWAMKHAHPGTLIIADNVIRDGQVLDENSSDEKVKGVQAYNTMLSKREDVITTIIPNISGNGYDGMAISFVK